ncbi:MAG: TetR/AcrR family transcriptional regulator, partial [Methylomarinum sp.]|nr:TetR/AcrR family transcriptional regulator [Methylomarinum sp.]
QQFKRLPASHTDEESQLAARALWSGVHGVCTLSLTGKLDLVGVNNVENTVVLLVDNFIKGWESS